MHAHTRTHAHTHMTHTHMHTHTCTHTRTYTHTHAHTHACTHTHIHTCTHAHKGIYHQTLINKKLGMDKMMLPTRVLPFLIPISIEPTLNLKQVWYFSVSPSQYWGPGNIHKKSCWLQLHNMLTQEVWWMCMS